MLKDMQVRNAKPAAKPYKLADTGNLHLFVSPAGTRIWRLRYRYAGKENLLTLGTYPDMSLDAARMARDTAKRSLKDGRDPSQVKKAQRAANLANSEKTFKAVATDWHAKQSPTWAERHAADVLDSLERDVFPTLGDVPLADITAPMVLAVLRPIEKRPAVETARRVRQRMSAVFVYGIASGLCENDPAAVVQSAMAPLKKGRQPAVTTLEQAREILMRVDDTPAHPVTRLALRFLALTVVRPGTLIGTPWTELRGLPDAEQPVWQIPAERMKLKLQYKDDEARDHLVPLATQAVDTIRALWQLTGRGPLCFTNARHAHKPMSENAIGYLLNRAGYHHRHVPHGWRATFSTIMNERYPLEHRMIDLMLAHVPKDKVEGAYNRAAHLQRRRELAQEWADMLMDGLLPAAELTVLPRR